MADTPASAKNRGERGIVMVLTALSMTVIFGFVGLALDVGQFQWYRMRAQTAADSAVLAAITERQKGTSSESVTGAARYLAELNGFKHGTGGVTVVINSPPTSGPRTGDLSAVEAVVQRQVKSFFLGFLGRPSANIGARSVARLGPGGGCIYGLNKTASGTVSLGGSQSTYTACDVIAESSSASGFSMNGSSILYMKGEARVGTVGGYSLGGGTSVRAHPSGAERPPETIDDPGDPLAWKPVPSMTGLAYHTDGKFTKNKKPGGGTTIPPGIYCGGIDIGNTGSDTFQMSGLYVVAGGGLKISSQARVSGTNVTIYLTSGPRTGTGCTSDYDGLSINGGSEISLTAPTSGPQEGMLIFQDRGIVDSKDHTINGSGTLTIDGAVYIPKSPIKINGNSSLNGYMIIVGDTITITGNSSIGNDYTTLASGSPVRTQPTLVE